MGGCGFATSCEHTFHCYAARAILLQNIELKIVGRQFVVVNVFATVGRRFGGRDDAVLGVEELRGSRVDNFRN